MSTVSISGNDVKVRTGGVARRRAPRRLAPLAALIASALTLALPSTPAFGEGSVDINTGPGGAVRHSLGGANPGGGQRSPLQVYAQTGETIQMASSLMGLGQADILLFAPGDDPLTATPLLSCATSQPGSGRIASRAEELAGPQPNVGGYDACDFTATATGAYTVIIVGADSENGTGGTVDAPATTIAQGRNASMWDVTVRDAGGTVQPGRLFSRNIQFRTTSSNASDFEAFVYTKTGYEYRVNFFEHSGVNWILAPDDLGVIDATTGERLFASFACGEESNPDVNRPCIFFDADLGPASRRYPVFFNEVDPVVISGAGGLGATLGYSDTPIAPSNNPVSQPTFTGANGQQGATSRGEGGTIAFTTPAAMAGLSYTFAVDIDGNGVFGDDGDFVDAAEELAGDGNNAYVWSGLDANGAAPECGAYDYQIATTLSEVHFAMEDVENSGGTRIERLSLPADPELGDPLAASYNNVDPYKNGFVVTDGLPAAQSEAISGPGFNAWSNSTGNTDRIDTWVRSPEVVVSGTLKVLCADLGITKTAPAAVAVGGEVTWALTVTNHGPDPSAGSTVTDTIPAGIANVSSPTPGCSVAAGSLSCAVGELAVGASTQITLTGAAPKEKTCFANAASVKGEEHDPNPANDTASVQTCTLLANISIQKRASERRVRLGDPITYTLLVRNAGPDPSLDTQVSDPVPDHLDARKATASKGKCSLAKNNVQCALGSLAVEERVRIEVEAVAVRVGGVLNEAVVTDERCAQQPCDSDPVKVKVVKPRLRLSKKVGKRVLRAGETTSYRIVVSNPSGASLRNVRTCDRLPAGLVYVRSKPNARLSGGRHCWTLKRLGAGERATYRVVVRALAGAGGKLVNTATATSPDAKSARARRAVRVIGGSVTAGGVTG